MRNSQKKYAWKFFLIMKTYIMLKFFMVVDFLKDSWPNELDHQVQHFHNQPRDPPAPRCKPMMMEMFVGTLRKFLVLTQNNL